MAKLSSLFDISPEESCGVNYSDPASLNKIILNVDELNLRSRVLR